MEPALKTALLGCHTAVMRRAAILRMWVFSSFTDVPGHDGKPAPQPAPAAAQAAADAVDLVGQLTEFMHEVDSTYVDVARLEDWRASVCGHRQSIV
jgi:hypothetical protein